MYNPALPPPCKIESMRKSDKNITKKCVSFVSCMANMTEVQRSRPNESDLLKIATELYNNWIISSPSKDYGLEFNFIYR